MRPNDAVGLEPGGPREDEHRLDVEQHEEQGEDVVADLALRPAVAHGIDAALVGEVLLLLGPDGPEDARRGRGASPPRPMPTTGEDGDGEVLAQEVRDVADIVVPSLVKGRTRHEILCGRGRTSVLARVRTTGTRVCGSEVTGAGYWPCRCWSRPRRPEPLDGESLHERRAGRSRRRRAGGWGPGPDQGDERRRA